MHFGDDKKHLVDFFVKIFLRKAFVLGNKIVVLSQFSEKE